MFAITENEYSTLSEEQKTKFTEVNIPDPYGSAITYYVPVEMQPNEIMQLLEEIVNTLEDCWNFLKKIFP